MLNRDLFIVLSLLPDYTYFYHLPEGVISEEIRNKFQLAHGNYAGSTGIDTDKEGIVLELITYLQEDMKEYLCDDSKPIHLDNAASYYRW